MWTGSRGSFAAVLFALFALFFVPASTADEEEQNLGKVIGIVCPSPTIN
jgi:hypothetical protein